MRVRSHEMSKDTQEPPLPPLGDHRPNRADIASAENGGDGAFPLTPLSDHRPTRADDAVADDGVDTAPPLSPADPQAAPPPAARQRFGRTASMLAACGAHILVLLALVSVPPTEFGSGGSGQDAISISIISASALDARVPTADTSAQSAPARVAPKDGDDVADSTAASEQSRPPEETKERPTAKDAVPDERLAAPVAPAPEVIPDEAPKLTSPPVPPEETKVTAVEPPPPPEEPRKKEPTESESPRPTPETRTDGGETSIGAAANQSPQAAAASASRGKVFAYGLAVQSALLAVDQREARALVAASKLKGTVVVKLVLDGTGALARAEIVKSSGSPELDRAALLLTRRATYPPPPSDIETAELAYIAPVRFR